MSQHRLEERDAPEGPGLTALIVAQARAAESARPDRLFEDPFAAEFIAAAGAAFPATSEGIARLLRLRGGYIAIRTRFFDDYLLDACRAGCRQVVLLAAGLDARAFRLAWPGEIDLFELDLPDVLAFKERALAARAAAPGCRRVVVPVDLHEDWPAALVAAGFQPHRATAWLAEGILMYLAEDERDRLLDQVAALSAAGSRLALDLRGGAAPAAERDGADEEESKAANVDAARLGVRVPAGPLDPSLADPAAWLERHGWTARVYDAGERFAFYGRPAERAEATAVQGWLASAERPGAAR